MEDENFCHRTVTSDSASGTQKMVAIASGAARSEILLRHQTALRWCSAGGDWVADRTRAVRFSTNLDALVYCEAMGVSGVVVAFDRAGGPLYELNVDRIREALSIAPQLRSIFPPRHHPEIWLKGAEGEAPSRSEPGPGLS